MVAVKIPFCRPCFGEAEERAVVETIRSGWVTTGPKTVEFESQFARHCGAKHAVGVNSGTAAIHLGLIATGIGRGDEVLVPAITWPSAANMVVHLGARPVFVDVELSTLNMNVKDAEARITRNTKAILPVHFAGHPCDLDAVHALAAKHRLVVIEDAAHAVEAEYRGRPIGALSDATAFSFYATKNLATGEGGMLTTNRDDVAEAASVWRLHGISRDAWKRYTAAGYRHWELVVPGFKYNMFDMQAALGLCQLEKLDMMWRKRRDLVRLYDAGFTDLDEVHVLARSPEVKHSYHLYVVIFKTELLRADRDEIMAEVQRRGVGIGVHFRAVHLQPYYAKTLGHRPGDLPISEYASDRVLSLPLYPDLTPAQAGYVIEVVRDVVKSLR